MLKFETLDLDCEHIENIVVKKSASGKHWHIILTKNKNCDCDIRKIFDDATRYLKDFGRPEHSRNVLFTKKTIMTVRLLLFCRIVEQLIKEGKL